MHRYFIKTPWIARKFFSSYLWKIPGEGKKVFLSFDDGPHPEITPWVLDVLKEYRASASFFCIGENVQKYPGVYQSIIEAGHAVGNHTFHHFNGWKTKDGIYLDDVSQAAGLIHTALFRPPYGRIRSSQAEKIPEAMNRPDARIVMWDVLSGDFDPEFTPRQCFMNVATHTDAGSVVVFHDSEKAYKNLEYALPEALKYLTDTGFEMEKIREEMVCK